ncbi:DUF5615 family PIN-like protein [Methylomagnum sp.]
MSAGLLADENFPLAVIEKLSKKGFDVLSVSRISPGVNDLSVLDLARRTGRKLLTFDSDFGDLVFFHGVPPPEAILYFRFHPIIVDEIFDAAIRALRETPDGYFAVITRDNIRLRSLNTKPTEN